MKPSITSLIAMTAAVATVRGADIAEVVGPFLETHCFECHAGGSDKGGLDFDKLGSDLGQPGDFATWERVFDRVMSGEMPPEKVEERPAPADVAALGKDLGPALTEAHAARKGTVLRRLNRREYENTLNDMFGTRLDLEGMLPEDGRSHEFDTVGEALGISMAHLERYLEAARLVFDTAVARTLGPPEVKVITGSFRESEIASHVGKTWKRLEDGAIVRFEGGGYPSGMLRDSGVQEPGYYRVKVSGYAYQSEGPVVCSIGGESYQQGSEKPVYTYVQFPPGKPGTAEFTTWIEKGYMLVVEPQGIALPHPRPEKIGDYEGPGFALLSATLEGPLVGEFPSRGHHLVFGELERREIPPGNPEDRKRSWYQPKFEIVTSDEWGDAMGALVRVAARAWRRPVEEAEVESYLGLFADERAGGAGFEEALRTAITGLFVSPKFLYLREGPGRLDGYAVADRLAYFLTRTAPDEDLRGLASGGKLVGQIRQQTGRLIADPRFGRFVTDFAESWLNLREMDFTAPDKTLFPEFDAYLRYSMPLETEAFLRELVESNLPVRDLVASDFAMLNGRLAEHYGLPPVAGPEIRKVKLPAGSVRGGLLTQASILKVSANGTNTSPIVRGVWVLERILGDPPQPPPPGIPGVEPDIRGAETLRQILDRHRDSQSCNACHRKIDPPGFALECFDPIGGYRERFRSLGEGERVSETVSGRGVHYRLGPEVDASGALPDGRAFADYIGFREMLASDEEALAKAFVAKLLTFATGREMGFSDRPEIARIVGVAESGGYRVRDLIHLATESEIFLTK